MQKEMLGFFKLYPIQKGSFKEGILGCPQKKYTTIQEELQHMSIK